jgi:hypothetical protein
MINKIKLFITAFFQVLFVSANVFFISKENIIGILISSFMISFIWTFNVKKIAFGNNLDKIIYASGAGIGCLAGFYLSKVIYNFL